MNENLAENEKMLAFRNQEPIKATYFVEEIVTKADGVFLWVKLVVTSLLSGLSNGDRIADFDRRLHELPSDLEGLYTYIFNNISSRYLAEGSQMFQIMRAVNNWEPMAIGSTNKLRLCALTLSFAIENSEQRAINMPAAPILGDEVAKRVERIDKRLKVCCAGLLELSEENSASRDKSQEGDKTAPLLKRFGNVNIKYLHRTAKDFLDKDRIFASIQQATAETDFSIWYSLLKSYLLRLKTCQFPTHDRNNFGSVAQIPMEIAYTAQEEEKTSNIGLLDDLGRSLSRLRPNRAGFINAKDNMYRNSNSNEYLDEFWPDDFLAVASSYSLSNYLAVKLAMPNTKFRCKGGRSYLDYALFGIHFTRIAPEHAIDLLLQYSTRSDINEAWRRTLMYIMRLKGRDLPTGDLAFSWIKIFKLLLDYGADPGMQVVGLYSQKCSVSEALDRISKDHSEAAAELYCMISQRRQFLYRAGLLRRRKSPDPQKWHFRYH